MTVTGNTLICGNALAQINAPATAGTATKVKWDENRYFSPATQPFRPTEKGQAAFAAWQEAGFDKAGSLTANLPTGVKVFLRPNKRPCKNN